MPLRSALIGVGLAVMTAAGLAQAPAKLEFDVASIKLNTAGPASGGGLQELPGGTTVLTNVPISSLLVFALPPSVDGINVVGVPDWKDRYDVIVKAPAGTPREQVRAMWQNLLAVRMKFVAHIDEREGTTFALVLARPDGRLGPNLKSPTVDDCAAANAVPAPPPESRVPPDFSKRCGIGGTGTSLTSGRTTMDMLAVSLGIRAGGHVENRTGLDGDYAFTLSYAPITRGVVPAPTFGLPDFFTALQEQLGLRLQAEKKPVPFWVIDHMEPPTED